MSDPNLQFAEASTDAAPAAESNTSRYLKLHARKKEIEADLKEVKERMAHLEPLILQDWADNELTQVKQAGKTLHTRKVLQVSAPKQHREAVIEWLRSIGREDILAPQSSSFKALIAEEIRNDKDEYDLSLVPEEIKDLIYVNETRALGVRSS